MATRSQREAENVRTLLKARNCFLWVITNEEARVEAHLAQAAAAAGFLPRFWDVASGVTDMAGNRVRISDPLGSEGKDPGAILAYIESQGRGGDSGGQRGLWVLRDFPAWLAGPPMATTLRQARNLARYLPGAAMPQAVVVLTPSAEVPPELQGHAVVINWPMPDRAELAAMLDSMTERYQLKFENGSRDAAIDAAVGLSGEEAESCYARSLVQLKRIDPALVASEKKSVIARAGLLEWMDPFPAGFDGVGGLDTVKAWMLARKAAYSPRARAYGLPTPRGMFLLGVSGCGKTMIAKATATALGNVPLIRLDIGALKNKFVGSSEANFRKAQQIIGTVGRCVVLIDEIEKALAGATQGAADGGVSADALGSLLTWMQERTNEAFIIATANDVSQLPPELLRKGRWDELFWVDLPTVSERCAILGATLRAHSRDFATIDKTAIANACDGFTGAEIAAIVPDALFVAFADNERQITTQDLIAAAGNVTPLSETAKEKIDKMREWAKGRARPATTQPEAKATRAAGRALDL